MYQKRFGSTNRGRNFSPRNNFQGRSRANSGRRNSRPRGARIDISKFISKAKPAGEVVQYQAQNTFETFNLHPILLTNVLRKGYSVPLPIQDQAIPHALQGKDVIGLANTGTGKTAAFLLPLIHKTLTNQLQDKTLIIAPTRELAEQIRSELFELTDRLGIYSVLAIGGANIRSQIYNLQRKHHFVIGTPGRLKDLNVRRVINFGSFNNIVLDEVDRMFDMGFSRDINMIMSELASPRQSLFFSATINAAVEELIRKNSQDPVRISVVRGATSDNVDQDIVRIANFSQKLETLHDLLNSESFDKVLIFGKTKIGVNQLAMELRRRGFVTESIHGNKSQSQRQKALSAFKQGKVNILVATDVAARGLDIPNVSHVINYELPENYDDYVHRIGRAGRAGKPGKALTFVH